MAIVWSEDRVEKLRKLWADGLTTGEIGKRLGVSKNSVVGKAHRLNLESRPSPIRRSAKKIEKAKKKPTVYKLADLTSQTCRWPFGDPTDDNFHFCGLPVFQSKPYCLDHCAQAFVGSNRKTSDNSS